jgi:hypothetical protein
VDCGLRGRGLLLAALAGVLVLRSQWFHGKVRTWLVSSIETATGGRAEMGAFRFDWADSAGGGRFLCPARHRARRQAAAVSRRFHRGGAENFSLVKRDIDIRSLDVEAPRIALIIDANGRTNLPQPKTPGRRGDTWRRFSSSQSAASACSTASFRWNRTPACRSRRRAGTSMARSLMTPPVRATGAISPSSRWSSPLPAVAQTARHPRVVRARSQSHRRRLSQPRHRQIAGEPGRANREPGRPARPVRLSSAHG